MYKHDRKTTQEPSLRGHCGYREGRDFSMECANVSHIYLYITKFFFKLQLFLLLQTNTFITSIFGQAAYVVLYSLILVSQVNFILY